MEEGFVVIDIWSKRLRELQMVRAKTVMR